MKKAAIIVLVLAFIASASGFRTFAQEDFLPSAADAAVETMGALFAVATPAVAVSEPITFEIFTNLKRMSYRLTYYYFTDFEFESESVLAYIVSNCDKDGVRLYRSYDCGEEWIDFTNDESVKRVNGNGIELWELNEDEEYTFKVEIIGGGSIIARSEPFTFVMPSDDELDTVFTGGGRNDANRLPVGNGDSGNDDSGDGDSGGQDDSAATSTTTSGSSKGGSGSNSKSPAQSSSAALTQATARLTSAQIANQAKVNPKYVTFAQNGIKLEAPTENLLSLGLSANESLDVTFAKMDSARVYIKISVSERTSQSGLPLIVYFPYVPEATADPSNLVVSAPNGSTTGVSFYDETNKRMIFWATQSGTYTVMQAQAPSYKDTAQSEEEIRFISARLSLPWVKDNAFSPGGTTLQSDFLALLYELSNGKQAENSYRLSEWAKSGGIIAKDGQIAEQSLTREHAAQYLCGFAKARGFLPNATASTIFYGIYADDGKPPQSAEAYGSGIDPAFEPEKTVTHAECAEILSRFIQTCYR